MRAALTPAPRRRKRRYGANAESPMMPADANRPLAGIVVLDFGQVYQEPVIACNSSFTYKGQTVDVKLVGRTRRALCA
jgi:hypothetical protein